MKNLTLHLVKKDLRHLWPWLALWWATFVFAALYPVWAFNRLMDSTAKGSDPSFILVTSLSCIILTLVIVAMLVEADAPLDDRSFWRTQPVAPARLLAAKFIFLIAFGLVVPLLIKFISLAAYGFSWEQGWPAFQNFAQIIIYALVVLFLAASFFRRPLVGYAVLIGLFLLALFFVNTAPNYIVNNFPASPKDIWLLLSLFLAILIASVSCIFLRRRRRLAIRILVLGLLFDTGLGFYEPGGHVQPPHIKPPAVLPPFTLATTFNLARIGSLTNDGGRQFYLVEGNFTTGSLPSQPTEVWYPWRSGWTFSWPDHTSASDSRFLAQYVFTNPEDFPASGFPFHFAEALQAFGVKHLLTTIDYDSPEFLTLTPAVFQRLRQSPAVLTGNLTFAVGRLEEVVRLPLTPGAVSYNPPSATGLISTNLNGADALVTVALAERFPARVDDQSWTVRDGINLLINPKTGEALIGYPSMTDTSTVLSDLTLARADFVFRFQYFTAPGKVYDIPRDQIQSWLASAQFVRLRLVFVGFANGAFTLNPLVIPSTTP